MFYLLSSSSNSLSGLLLRNLFKRKSIQFSLLISITAIGTFSTLGYQNFLYLQAQNISHLSVYNQIFKPLSGLVLLTEVLLACIVASQLVPVLFERGQQGIILHSAKDSARLALSFMMVVLLVTIIPILVFLFISIMYSSVSLVDAAMLMSLIAGLLFGGLLFSSISFSASLLSRRSLVSLVICIVGIVIVFSMDELFRNSLLLVHLSIYIDFFIHIRDGLILPFEVIRLLLWVGFFYTLSVWILQIVRTKKASQPIKFVLISFLFVFLFGSYEFYLTTQSNNERFETSRWDVSHAKRNSLNERSLERLSQIKKPIKLIAVIDKEENHDELKKAFEVIKHYHQASSLEFTNRQTDGKENTLTDQYVAIEIGQERQSIKYPFSINAKDALIQLIMQLTTRANQWITFIEGHGEASPFAKSNRDIATFYNSIKALGWPVAVQNLRQESKISSNTQILVIAASQKHWLPAEIDSIMRYLQDGGNLLLLREQNDQLPNELLSYIGISTEIGVLIDWQGYQSGTPHPAVLIVNQFNDHPINTGINSLLAFPWSHALVLEQNVNNTQRDYQRILNTHSGVWTEHKPNDEQLSFNEDEGELRQSFSIGYSYVDSQINQRVIVMGDTSFLSDSAINNYANHQFAMNLISWLAYQSNESVDTPYRDSYIQSDRVIHFILSWFFSAILPVILVLLIFFRRLSNRRNSHS